MGRAGKGVLDIAVLNLIMNALSLLIPAGLLITGWIVTRKQYYEQSKQYQGEIDRLIAENKRNNQEHDEEMSRIIAANKDMFEQQQLAYARMVVAKDDQIERLQHYMEDWKQTALTSLTGLKDVSRNAVTVAETVVGKLGG